MAQATTKDLTTLPVGRLGLIPLISCKDLGEKVNEWLIQWRKERSHEELDSFAFEDFCMRKGFYAFFRHTVNASQITSVCQGNP